MEQPKKDDERAPDVDKDQEVGVVALAKDPENGILPPENDTTTNSNKQSGTVQCLSKKTWVVLGIILVALVAVGVAVGVGVSVSGESDGDSDASREIAVADSPTSSGTTSSTSSGGDSGNGNQGSGKAGVVTAAEWNDLKNWDFWNDLVNSTEYNSMPSYWGFYHNNRISIVFDVDGEPLVDAEVQLFQNGQHEFTGHTDNTGRVELWVGLLQELDGLDPTTLSLKVNGNDIDVDLTLFEDKANTVTLDLDENNSNRVEIAFVVDATGSMSDELEFLKEDLKSVIERVEEQNNSLDIFTGAVFYRDQDDDYVTRESALTGNLDETVSFIGEQTASGGGDFPEAVHTALDKAINNLQWSSTAKARIAFLMLDAPPHYTPQVVSKMRELITQAAAKGIRIIPIAASGINKETEFLLRFIAITTNGTYVFITDDSGVGNPHLEASVGDFEVELLNDLLVRLIFEYSS